MNEKNELINKLHKLKQEHRDLDEILIRLQEKKNCRSFYKFNASKKEN